MDVKTMKATIVGLLVTLIIGSAYTMFTRRIEAGSEALTANQIKEVMTEVLVTDAGDTYGQAINKVEDRLLIIETNQEHFKVEVERVRVAIEALAAD